jgi:hypothetical protein
MTIIRPERTQALSLRINSPMEQNVVPVTVKSYRKTKVSLTNWLTKKSKNIAKISKIYYWYLYGSMVKLGSAVKDLQKLLPPTKK